VLDVANICNDPERVVTVQLVLLLPTVTVAVSPVLTEPLDVNRTLIV
jgi:hypothetical protein